MLNYRKETKKPFKVFMTEDEWNEAVLEEFEKMNQGKGEESGDEVSDIKARLLDEASRIKEQVPDFDFKRMLAEDPEFRERILKGYSVEEAFYLSNRKKNAEKTPKKRLGIRENGRSSSMGAGSTKNVSNMSDEEFKKYINSIKGSRI